MEPVGKTIMPECLHGVPLDTECLDCAAYPERRAVGSGGVLHQRRATPTPSGPRSLPGQEEMLKVADDFIQNGPYYTVAPGPFNTGTTDGLVNSLEARIVELETALKRADERDNDWNDLLQHNRDAADAAEARIVELESANAELRIRYANDLGRLERVETALCKERDRDSARITELEVDNERLQKLWKSAAGHGETCSVLLARIAELEGALRMYATTNYRDVARAVLKETP
jgi:hypothetical protein